MASNYGFLKALSVDFFEGAQVLGAPVSQQLQVAQEVQHRAHAAEQLQEPRASRAQQASPSKQQQEEQAASSTPAAAWSESGATCIACNIGISGPGFANAAEQRAHFKTDWHRYNLKRRVDKKAALKEQEFERMVEEQAEVSSISGSDTESYGSSEDEDGSSGDDMPSTSQRAQRRAAAKDAGKLPQALYQTKDGRPFALWRCLLLADHHKHSVTDEDLLPELLRVRCTANKWAVIMLRGGHFAAAVFQLKDTSVAKKGHAEEPLAVIAHKTFHRYVVRAGAGGKQSTKDASGKYARSAGSRLRRHNEARLQRDISQLMAEWRSHLADAHLIFVHAPSSNMRVLLAGSSSSEASAAGSSNVAVAGPVLDPSDPRIRRVPFVTQRPTFSELKRVVQLLGGVYLPAPSALAAAQAAATQAEEEGLGTAARSEHKIPLPAAEGAAANGANESAGPSGRSARTGAAAEAGIAAAAAKAGAAGKAEEPTLIKAAKAGDAERVQRLLEAGHDPTALDAKGRTAYVLAASKEVRDVMRRFMAQEPDRWDYAASGIPSALTEEREAAQQAKKAEKRAKQKVREKEQRAQAEQRKAEVAAAALASLDDEIVRAAAEAAAFSVKQASASKKGGGQVGAGGERGPQTPQEDAARRREMLAAAAEARMKVLQAATQQQQLW